MAVKKGNFDGLPSREPHGWTVEIVGGRLYDGGIASVHEGLDGREQEGGGARTDGAFVFW